MLNYSKCSDQTLGFISHWSKKRLSFQTAQYNLCFPNNYFNSAPRCWIMSVLPNSSRMALVRQFEERQEFG